MVRLSSTGELLAALSHATEVDAQAYTLRGQVFHALEAAARRGAHVVVRLEGRPFIDPKGQLAHRNQGLVDQLKAAGVDASLGHPLHAKAIAADGTLYLDDQNWGMRDLVVRDDDAADAAAIPMAKRQALAEEAELLRAARPGDDVAVESESFGRWNAVYSALDALGRAGVAPRLLVCDRVLRGNQRERAALDKLAADGVRVRVCDDSEKLALAGDRAWVGSANATADFGNATDMTDWGVRTGDASIVGAVRERIEWQWNAARDFTAAPPPPNPHLST